MPNLDFISTLNPSSIGSAVEVTVSNIASPTELNSRAAAQGDIILARTTEAGTGTQTWYYADTTSASEDLPYVVSSATAGIKFVAIAGAYTNTLTVQDGTLTITGSADHTKTLKFEVDAQSANADLTINTGAQTVDRTLTVPVLTGNATLATISQAQSFTGVQTFSDTTDSTSKDTGSIVTEGGLGVEKAVTIGTTLTVNGLTSGRVPFVSTNGLITDSSTFTYSTSGGTGLSISNASSSFYIQVSGAASFAKGFVFNTGGVSRWIFQADATAETGSDAGSPFTLYARTDAGGAIDTPISIVRAAGGTFTISRPTSFTSTTDATSSSTGSVQLSGGLNVAKNVLARQGSGRGLTSTATAAGTTTLTNASTQVQIFTGTTTQTLQLPAANLFGSGIGVEYIVINRSTGTVTAQRAGSDTFDGGGTTDAILTNTTRHYISNGSNQWHTIA